MSAHPTVVRFEDWPIAVAGFEDGAQSGTMLQLSFGGRAA